MSAGNANTFSCDLFNELTGLEKTVEVVHSATLIQWRDTEFVCTVQGGKSPVVTWKKISDNLDPNRHIQNGNNLQIKNIQPEDRGYFQCQADSEDSQTASAHVIVDVEARESPKIEVYPTGDEIEIELGSVAYAQCRVTAGAPTLVIFSLMNNF